MDSKQLAQSTVDQFNDRSFRTRSKDLVDANIVTVDGPTKQEMHGPDGYVQYNEGFVAAMPDIKGTVIGQEVNGNKVTTRVNAKGTFTGTMQMPQGKVPGTGKKLDIVYSFEMETNAAGKITRYAVAYDMQDFAHQLGLG